MASTVINGVTITSRADLKNYFNTGDKPTEAQFAELVDSVYHKLDGQIITGHSLAGNVLTINLFDGTDIVVTGDKYHSEAVNTPASKWTITHDLGKYPSVTTMDTAGTEIRGEIKHVSLTVVEVTFSPAQAGIIICN